LYRYNTKVPYDTVQEHFRVGYVLPTISVRLPHPLNSMDSIEFNVVCMPPQLLLKLETCWGGNTVVIVRLCRVRIRVATIMVPQFINLQTFVQSTWVNFGQKASINFFKLKFYLHRYWLIFVYSLPYSTYFGPHKKHNTTVDRLSKWLAIGGQCSAQNHDRTQVTSLLDAPELEDDNERFDEDFRESCIKNKNCPVGYFFMVKTCCLEN
jgi:hypothetical protein